jgi:hypothetical protein
MASALAWQPVQAAQFFQPAAVRVAHAFQRKRLTPHSLDKRTLNV